MTELCLIKKNDSLTLSGFFSKNKGTFEVCNGGGSSSRRGAGFGGL